MARLTPQFSANRTVREYTEQHYLVAAADYGQRAAGNGVLGRQIVAWQHALQENWPKLRFDQVNVATKKQQHLFEISVELGDLDPTAVRVELYADGIGGAAPVRQEMTSVRQRTGAAGPHIYTAAVSVARSPADYTARVIPHFGNVAVPLENAHILWQR